MHTNYELFTNSDIELIWKNTNSDFFFLIGLRTFQNGCGTISKLYVMTGTTRSRERRHILTQREQIRDLIRQTQTCDGSTTAAFNDSIIEIATKTVSGPLRLELERYIEGVIAANPVAKAAIPWADLRNHISAQFLNPDESAVLCDELENNHQSVYEPTAQYARRFPDVVDVVYPQRLLLKAFAKGLKSNELARKLVEQSPATIEAAIADVTRYYVSNKTLTHASDGTNSRWKLA